MNPFLIGVDFIPVVRDFVDKMAADITGVFSVRLIKPLKPCPLIKQIVVCRDYAGIWKAFQCLYYLNKMFLLDYQKFDSKDFPKKQGVEKPL